MMLLPLDEQACAHRADAADAVCDGDCGRGDDLIDAAVQCELWADEDAA